MCHRITTRYICGGCKIATRPPKIRTEHCPSAHWDGDTSCDVEVKEEVLQQQGCANCQQPPQHSTYNKPRSAAYGQRDYARYTTCEQRPAQTCARVPAYNMSAQGHQPHSAQYQWYQQPQNSKNTIWTDPVEQYYSPSATTRALHPQFNQTYQQGNGSVYLNHQANGPSANIQQAAQTRPTQVPDPTPTPVQVPSSTEIELQRTLDRTLQEFRLTEIRQACSGYLRRISELEDRLAVERERTQLERERRKNDWTHYSNEGKNFAAKSSKPKLPALTPGSWNADAGIHRIYVIREKAPKNRELWISEVRRIDGRLMEYRKRLKPWEYEVIDRR